MDADKLVALAKRQLGLNSSTSPTSLPRGYLQELQNHVKIHPHDTNFMVRPEPDKSYGRIICLETGCGQIAIAMEKNNKLGDGGKKGGVGTLAAYRAHISSHPTHAKERHARVKREKGNTKTFETKPRRSGVMRLDNSELEIKPVVKIETDNESLPRHSTVTRLPDTSHKSESAGPSKRLSDTFLNDDAVGLHSHPVPSPSKKVKVESPKKPLALVDSNSSGSLVNHRELKQKIENVDFRISDATLNLRKVKTKRRPRPNDLSTMRRYEAQLVSLRQERANYVAQLSAASAPPAPSRPPTASVAVPPPYNQQMMVPTPLPALYAGMPPQFIPPRGYAAYGPYGHNFPQPHGMPYGHPVGPIPYYQQPPPVPAPPAMPGAFPVPGATPYYQQPVAPALPFAHTAGPYNADPVPKREEAPHTIPTAGPSRLATPAGVPKREEILQKIPTAGPSRIIASHAAPLPKSEPVEASFNFPPVVKAPAMAQASRSSPTFDDEDGGFYGGEMAAQAIAQRLNVVPNIAALNNDEYDVDDQGNYFGRGRDNFQGPRAKADDIDQFLLIAGNAEQFDGNASVEDALKKLDLGTSSEKIPHLMVTLMAHQIIGVAWMLDHEQGPSKGGCLGDDMGLGKTVQMIALLVKNPSTIEAKKTTLIIAPTALLDQWKSEIELKTNNHLKCLVYHGSSKVRSKKELLKYAVVITTYQTMALEWPDDESEEKKKKRKKKQDDFITSDSDSEQDKKKKKKKDKGLLFQVEFYRIVLDEAQVIRNRRTRVSRAVTALESTYRWCLTGTPIVNGLADAYPYIRFLKIRPWYDFTEFHGHIGKLEKKQANLAVTRLQAIFSIFVLRRMKDSMLDGKKLIELPEKTIHMVPLTFSDEERAVEARSQATFNRFLRAGTVLKNYHQVLVLLLRLRQICNHPSLIQDGEGAAFVTAAEYDEHLRGDGHPDLTRARRALGPEFVAKMKAKFKEIALKRMEAERESAEAAVEDEECPICFDAFTDAVLTSCEHPHMYCRECITDVLNAPQPEQVAEDGAPKLKPNERPCPTCRGPICLEQLYARAAFEPTDEELNPSLADSDVEMASPQPRKGKAKKRTKKRARLEEDDDDDDDDMSDFIVQSDEDEEEKDVRRATKAGKRKAFVVLDSDDEIEDPEEVIFGRKKAKERKSLDPEAIKLLPKFLPSTKMKWMMDRIKHLAEPEQKPDEKILVVSQWTSCLQLCSDYLEENGILHVKYQGDMTRNKRQDAVRTFMTNDKVKVMLMSLKCGGVGLNLVRANNVISLDLGWSQAVESQAYDRVHRLGQHREVDVRRLVISNTVEDRILALQQRKQDLADGTLGEGKGKKLARLNVRELAQLFGLDARGRLLNPDDD